jgi:hypothetical protein
VNPKAFMLVVGNSAAEQRLVVAHSVSYGFGRPKGSKAPAGATEKYFVLGTMFPRLSPWATIVRRSAAY